MIKSVHNPRFAAMSDKDVSALYVTTYKARDADTMSDEELDHNDAELFYLDDELCARGLDLPSTN
jgi:hypothetical protein